MGRIQEVLAPAGSVTADLNRLSDGIHEGVAFRVTDMAGNVSVPVQMQLRRDTTKPEILIMAPADRAIARMEKWQGRGTVSDLHLAGWKLEAKDRQRHGAIRNLASWQKKEEEAEQTELQAVIDLSTYSDGENVVLNFSAWDEAGNEEKADRTLIRVGGAMSAFEPTLDLFVPELIKEAQVSGSYVGPAQGGKNTSLYRW